MQHMHVCIIVTAWGHFGPYVRFLFYLSMLGAFRALLSDPSCFAHADPTHVHPKRRVGDMLGTAASGPAVAVGKDFQWNWAQLRTPRDFLRVRWGQLGGQSNLLKYLKMLPPFLSAS